MENLLSQINFQFKFKRKWFSVNQSFFFTRMNINCCLKYMEKLFLLRLIFIFQVVFWGMKICMCINFACLKSDLCWMEMNFIVWDLEKGGWIIFREIYFSTHSFKSNHTKLNIKIPCVFTKLPKFESEHKTFYLLRNVHKLHTILLAFSNKLFYYSNLKGKKNETVLLCKHYISSSFLVLRKFCFFITGERGGWWVFNQRIMKF